MNQQKNNRKNTYYYLNYHYKTHSKVEPEFHSFPIHILILDLTLHTERGFEKEHRVIFIINFFIFSLKSKDRDICNQELRKQKNAFLLLFFLLIIFYFLLKE